VRTRRKSSESHKRNNKKDIKRKAYKLRLGGSHRKYKRISEISAKRAIKNASKKKTRYNKDSEQGRGTRAQGIIKRIYC
jgi:hypothetical protein